MSTRETARLYAEGQMPENWDRKDEGAIGAFYTHMIDYLEEELRKSNLWLRYEDWKQFNYTFDDYQGKYYEGGQTQGVKPFSAEYTESDLRKKYATINNL